jgi:RNA polymerase sigma-70 factor (ECF subfamily)
LVDSSTTEGFEEKPDQTLAKLFEATHQSLLRAVRRILRNDADADDVVQETYVAACSEPKRFTGASNPEAFLVGAAKMQALYRLRKDARTAKATVADPEAAELVPDPIPLERRLTSRQELEMLGRELRLMGPMQQRCVILWSSGHTQAEIAQELGISQPTVSVHLKRATRRFLEAEERSLSFAPVPIKSPPQAR